MILTITPNPAVDLTWHVDRFEPGATHRVATGASRAGGKGLNAARVLQATGHRVLALATAGGATGDELRADLEASGLPHRLITMSAATRRTVAIVDDRTGEASLLNEAGAPLLPTEAVALADAAEELGRTARAVAICGSLPPGFGADELGGLVERLAAAHVPTVVDTSGSGILAAASAGARALKPNREELEAATGHDEPLAGARSLLDRGARLVVVSLGADGLLVVPRDGVPVRARLPRVLHGNATGAGDAVVAAIASSLADGDEPWAATDAAAHARARLARRATAWSASAVLMPLAGELSPDHAELADEVRITTIDEDDR
ncbi:1-phosphofructokinase family hexose kinase [Agromyces sp. Marseille-P2726]|uniref:1-phosphofructokinase family hexose kinase n=1 Tax=Agromyces sp. Marseille-P2726 TaxID=2709132 RepID=UPI001570243D|nr:1-phosphofructokinase family hexose kinase [Agromyces sp. Marseille-P2726]